MFITFLKTFISQTNIIMTGKLLRHGADSDSSENWNRFWLMSMVESQSESFEIELGL